MAKQPIPQGVVDQLQNLSSQYNASTKDLKQSFRSKILRYQYFANQPCVWIIVLGQIEQKLATQR
jgi:hypothetical protein